MQLQSRVRGLAFKAGAKKGVQDTDGETALDVAKSLLEKASGSTGPSRRGSQIQVPK